MDLGESAYLFLISQPHLKSSNFARRPPFHVDAVDRQTSGGKMLIILGVAKLCIPIRKSSGGTEAL